MEALASAITNALQVGKKYGVDPKVLLTPRIADMRVSSLTLVLCCTGAAGSSCNKGVQQGPFWANAIEHCVEVRAAYAGQLWDHQQATGCIHSCDIPGMSTWAVTPYRCCLLQTDLLQARAAQIKRMLPDTQLQEELLARGEW